jgi:hypothetical protein
MAELDPEVRDYLRALQMLLAKAPPSWPAGSAFESLRTVLDAPGPMDLDRETEGLYKRLGEVEQIRTSTDS